MRLAALEPYLVGLVDSFGLTENLVAVCGGCPAFTKGKVTKARVSGRALSVTARAYSLEASICSQILNPTELQAADPEVIITQVPADKELVPLVLDNLREDLAALLGHEVSVFSYNPCTLDGVFEVYQRLARDLGVPDKGLELAHRQKAQFMVWGDNFYERIKGKRLSVLSSVEPLKLAGLWVPDLIRLAGALSQAPADGQPGPEVEWVDVLKYRPDVILVAPEGMDLKDAARLFRYFEKLPGWDDIPAVKRGEVYFASGATHFYRPGPELTQSMAVLMSVLAGFESGYITPRDSFYKLRWLEVQRHRF
ncbi:MAG: hypothetical protein GX589_08585 [Deltaproteobacteria bacterium]|nr:hypothetical protein [Deltaproteobacteria bacterium]